MAYISAEDTKQIRKALKAAFPGFKFSVRNDNHLAVNVKVMAGPVDLNVLARDEDRGFDVNHYHLGNYGEHQEFFQAILDVIKMAPERGWFDESDSMTDYFHTAFYIHMGVGAWDKPYEYKPSKKAVDTNYAEAVQAVIAQRQLEIA